ncbi:HWE histidine kinase domain-containing protein [Methylobacterium durans]|uniref:sensor histidine kinase n=1 Tax=Methylobacterium durans TaxID=2202825 RepID=UPI002AFFC34F|nr:HWE histidine kinase domain-containing protein [Methylobacterium durans]MEA1831311.1 HWE histidine kinase domain-containing protein [Methylobacterium durans]
MALRILYIDDDAGLVRLVARALRARDCAVEHAADGSAGLARIAEGGIDAVALDHHLPGETGLDILARIRALPAPPPVIYVTGSDDLRIAVAALKAGAADYVLKDVAGHFRELLGEAIEAALAQERLRRDKAEAEQRLAASQERLNLALGAAGMIGTWDWDLVADLVYADANFARIYTVDPEAAARGAPLAAYIKNFHPDDVPAFQAALDRTFAGADEFSCEYRILQPEGGVRWILARGRLVRDGTGRPVRFAGASVDITDRKLAEERQRLLMLELAHRVKNTLTLVQAICLQTLRGDATLAEAREVVTARLLALAQAHDLLLQGSWSEASLRTLVEGTARLHGHGDAARFRLSGPDVMLGPKSALSVALVLHELGTNAAKYGALSTPEGHVAVGWEQLANGAEPRLSFRWEEVGGPPVRTPSRRGFGSRLIERSLSDGLGAQVRLAYPPTGVTLTLDAPLEALRAS